MVSSDQNSFERTTFNQFHNNVVYEEGQDFLDYLICLGLLGEPNLLVLSMRHQNYFDNNDLKDIKVLVIPKKLNMIKNLDSFLHIVFRVLPSEAYFIGCFSGRRSLSGNEIPLTPASTNFNKFNSILAPKTNWDLDKDDVTRLLESHGFRTVDMTEIKGQYYFAGKNKRMSL